MRRVVAVLSLALGALAYVGAHAQSVQQSGSVTRGHLPAWAGSGVVQDAGTSANPQLNAVAAYGSGGCPISITSTTTAGAPTGSYLQGCLSASNTGVQLSVTPFGGLGTQPFIININGTSYSIGGTNWLSGIFDQQFSSTQGSVLYRNATTWVALPPGNSGQVLQTLGAGQNVQWAGSGGVGSVTSITAGTGLTGGTITSSGTIALSNPVTTSLGGTGLATLTAHNVILGEGTSQVAFAAPGVAGQCLASNGVTSDPTFQACAGVGTVTSITAADGTLTVSPSPLVSSGTIKVATNGVANANLAQMAGDTIKANVTGSLANATDATPGALSAILCQPQVTVLTSGTATYTTPTCNSTAANTLSVRMAGAGGGGGGSGSAAGAGSAGGNTTFGTSLLTANGGNGGAGSGGAGGAGGTTTGCDVNIAGANGMGPPSGAINTSGGSGAPTPFGGGGPGGNPGVAGIAAPANTGAGGGGGGVGGTGAAGAGGGGGGYCEKLITTPSATYTYVIGGSGSNGTPGASGFAGANGGSGIIIIKAAWQ